MLARAPGLATPPADDDDDEDELEGGAPELKPALISPSDGAVLTVSPWVPLAVRLPLSARGAILKVTLDGQPWSDPRAILRKRNDHLGGGLDYLATFPLLDLAPGLHRLDVLVTPPGAWPYTLSSTFSYEPPPHTLNIRVVDGEGRPSPARVVVWKDGQRLLLMGPDAYAVDPDVRDPLLSSVFAPSGEARLRVEPGHYRLIAVRGFREDLGVVEQDIAADAELTLSVPERVPTPGVWTADLHVHTGASADSFTPNLARYAALACAGLDLVVITDHNQRIDPTEDIAAVGAAGRLGGLPGLEVPVRGKSPTSGHLNAFPLGPGSPAPGGLTLAQTLDRYRAIAEEYPWPPGAEAEARLSPILMLNHPRGIQFRPESPPKRSAHGLFSSLGYDRALPPGEGGNAWMTVAEESGTTALDMDVLEIVNRFSWPLYKEVRRDWFALLNAGVGVTGAGNSDSHALALELAGSPVNLVDVGESPSPATFLDSLRRGRVSVSTGPILSVRVRDGLGGSYGPGEQLSSVRPVLVEARVQAPPWVPVPELRLVRNGKVIASMLLPDRGEEEGLDYTQLWTLDASRDGWVLVEAGWPLEPKEPKVGGLFEAVYPNAVPLAFTNPVRIDGDRDGDWRP